MYPDPFGTASSLHRCTPRTQYLPLFLSLSSSALYRLYRKLWPQLCRVGHVEAIKKKERGLHQMCSNPIPINSRYPVIFTAIIVPTVPVLFRNLVARDIIENVRILFAANIRRIFLNLNPFE